MVKNYVPDKTKEEAIGEAEEAIKNLEKRMLIMDDSEKIALSDLISDIRKQLNNYLSILNN